MTFITFAKKNEKVKKREVDSWELGLTMILPLIFAKTIMCSFSDKKYGSSNTILGDQGAISRVTGV